jgi:SAM-dependent methyltransferase
MIRAGAVVACAASLIVCGAVPALPAQTTNREPARAPDVVFIPTPSEVVTAMLEMAKVGPDDVVYDLGSGDGRIVIAAVKDFHAKRGVGIEIDPVHVAEANATARSLGLSDRLQFRRQDLFEADFSEATVVTLYLQPVLNRRLRPKLLAELEPGTRIVSHAFDMGDWEPDDVRTVSGRKVFLWTVPEG